MSGPKTDAEACAAIENALEEDYNDDREELTPRELRELREDAMCERIERWEDR